MRRIGEDISSYVASLGKDSDEARLNMRIQQVRARYKAAIESVYPQKTAKLHLAHTNSVIVTTVKGVRTLIVYVDESIFAAELNAQRELIKLTLLEQFGEDVEEFQIKISRWKKFRKMHPYLDEDSSLSDRKSPSIPLDEDELSFVSETVSVIEDEKVRKSLEKAMTVDLEWKKGEKVERKRKESK